MFGFGYVGLRSSTKRTYRYASGGSKNMVKVLKYFDLFPLRTKKGQALVKWRAILEAVLSKHHLTEKGFEELKVLSKQVNIISSVTTKTGAK